MACIDRFSSHRAISIRDARDEFLGEPLRNDARVESGRRSVASQERALDGRGAHLELRQRSHGRGGLPGLWMSFGGLGVRTRRPRGWSSFLSLLHVYL